MSSGDNQEILFRPYRISPEDGSLFASGAPKLLYVESSLIIR